MTPAGSFTRDDPQQTLPGMELRSPPVEHGLAGMFTDEQRQAVLRRSEPLIVSAAAGSGKTSVLVERFVAAVREDRVDPARILAITFTERAAGELRSRVRESLLGLGDREAARDTETAYIGTFHGFCARLLRTHALAAGVDPDFAILDEGLAGRARELAFKVALRELLDGERSDAIDLLAAYGVDRVRAMIERIYAELRSRGQQLPRLPVPAPTVAATAEADATAEVAAAADADAQAARDCALLDQLLERFGLAYDRLKRDRGELDFDDLELLAGGLLAARDSVRVAWSERFELLMVDEFQDTNPRQLAILGALDHGNLFTVGDELQSIYGFRHAEVRLFRQRREALEHTGASLALRHNFRSRAPLLDVVNAVFAERFGDHPPLVAAREQPPLLAEPAVELLLTDAAGWEQDEHLLRQVAEGLPHTQPWRQAEARALAARVAELVWGGEAHAGEIVVLLRSAGDLEVYERALALHGLRTLAAVGTFWGHQQIGDLICYLRALANPLDEEAFYSLLASPLVGCSRDCLALLADAARQSGHGVWQTALDALSAEGELLSRLASGDRRSLAHGCELLAAEREHVSRRTISELIERAIQAGGYRSHVLGLEWGERRLANVHKLLRLARRFEAGEGRDLRSFLDHVQRLREAVQAEPDAPVAGEEPDAVRLMTVHAAKGLEFPVVCVADLGRQPNTQTPDLLVDGQRIGIRLVRLDGARSRPTLEYDALCAERRRREAEEEDRILYVAMTRARERLLLSGSIDFARWPRSEQAPTPISWLGPALAPELPALVAGEHQAVHDLPVGLSGATLVRCRLGSAAAFATGSPSAAPDRARAPVAEREQAGGGVQLPAQSPSPGTPPGDRPSRRRLPEVDDQDQLAAFSYTSLSELERCGYRYYLERVLGLPEDQTLARADAPAGALQARTRGTLVHALMESLDFAASQPVTDGDVADAAGRLGVRVAAAERRQIARLIASACDQPPAARVAAARMLRREHPFAFSLGEREPLITGVIDLLAEERDGSLLVVDYKSDRVAVDLDLAELVEREYGAQRLLYALAVLRDGALAVEVAHWFLERPREWIAVRYTAADRPALEADLGTRIERARRQRYAVSADPHRGLCLTCPGRAELCSWGERETLRDDPHERIAPSAEDA